MTDRKIFSTIVLAIIVTSVLPIAFGHDSNSNIMTYNPYGVNESETIWYNITGLNGATLDNESNGAGIRLITEVSRNVIHNTDFDLVEVSDYLWPHTSKVDAMYLGTTNAYGATSTHKGIHDGSPYLYKVIWLNTHDNLNYNTRGSCNIFGSDVPAQYILNHEFGHLAGLNHHHYWTGF